MIGCAEPTGTNCNAESPCCASDQLAAPTLTSLDQLSYTNLSLHQPYKLPGYKKKAQRRAKEIQVAARQRRQEQDQDQEQEREREQEQGREIRGVCRQGPLPIQPVA